MSERGKPQDSPGRGPPTPEENDGVPGRGPPSTPPGQEKPRPDQTLPDTDPKPDNTLPTP